MKRISHFRFSRSQRSGIFFLGICVVVIQVLLWKGVFDPEVPVVNGFDDEVDKVNAYMDSVSSLDKEVYVPKPFNPNYMSDQRGYAFGMSPGAIDRLFAFREHGGFIQSTEEFRRVTGVPDSVLAAMAPYFRFPRFADTRRVQVLAVAKKDINKAELSDLQKVYGVGPVLAERIVAYRDKLGGYSVKGQVGEVYGVSGEVIPELWRHFHLDSPAVRVKLDINTADLDEIASVPYVSRSLAAKVVGYRSMGEHIDSLGELTKFHNLSEKDLNRIGLYLKAEKKIHLWN